MRWASPTLDIYSADVTSKLSLPFPDADIVAGFPSPATDYLELAIDLNKELVRNPDSTYYARVKGNSMRDAMISEGDMLVIDHSIQPESGDTVVCFLDGTPMVKRIRFLLEGCELHSANPKFPTICVSEFDNFRIFGVVTYTIRCTWGKKERRWICMR